MPNRVIKESIWTSPNLNKVDPLAERHFYRLLLCADDFGCCECSPLIVKGKCYPLQLSTSPNDIDLWQFELEKQHLLFRWSKDGRQYAIFPTFAKHQRVRSLHQRKTPAPPSDVENLCRQQLTLDDICQQTLANDNNGQQAIADDRLNPNPNPNPNPSGGKGDGKTATSEIYKMFDQDFQRITPTNSQQVGDLIDTYGTELLKEAMKEAVKQNKRSLAYVNGICKSCKAKGTKPGAPKSAQAGTGAGKSEKRPAPRELLEE